MHSHHIRSFPGWALSPGRIKVPGKRLFSDLLESFKHKLAFLVHLVHGNMLISRQYTLET